MGPLSRIELELTTAEFAYDNHKTLEGRPRLAEADRRRLASRRLYLILLNLEGESMWLSRRDARILELWRATHRSRGLTRHARGLWRRDEVVWGRKSS